MAGRSRRSWFSVLLGLVVGFTLASRLILPRATELKKAGHKRRASGGGTGGCGGGAGMMMMMKKEYGGALMPGTEKPACPGPAVSCSWALWPRRSTSTTAPWQRTGNSTRLRTRIHHGNRTFRPNTAELRRSYCVGCHRFIVVVTITCFVLFFGVDSGYQGKSW